MLSLTLVNYFNLSIEFEEIDLVRIKGLFGDDRGFVGEEWFEYLNFDKIPYARIIRNNLKITNPITCRISIIRVFNNLKVE